MKLEKGESKSYSSISAAKASFKCTRIRFMYWICYHTRCVSYFRKQNRCQGHSVLDTQFTKLISYLVLQFSKDICNAWPHLYKQWTDQLWSNLSTANNCASTFNSIHHFTAQCIAKLWEILEIRNYDHVVSPEEI